MSEEMKQKTFKKESGLAGILGMFAKVLPATLVQTLGGPAVAGMIVAVGGGIVVGVPAAYLGVKAVSVQTPAKKSAKQSAFSKFFGDQSSAIESISPEAAARAKALAEEEARSDEETSLGLLIPEELPGSKKDTEIAKEGEQAPSALTASGQKLNPEELAKWKSRFGSSGGEGGGSGGGAMSMASAGGQTSVGKQSALGGAGAAMGAGGGAGMARGKKTSVKSTKALKGKQTGGYEGLKGAAKIASRGAGYGDQLGSGHTGAAFGELGRAGIIAGGPSASVGGVTGGIEGGVSSPDPSAGLKPSGGGGVGDTPEKHISHPYTTRVNYIKWLMAAAAATALTLLYTSTLKDTFALGAPWWIGFFAGLGVVVGALGVVMSLFAGDEFAKSIAGELIWPALGMLGAYAWLGIGSYLKGSLGSLSVANWLHIVGMGALAVGSVIPTFLLGGKERLNDKCQEYNECKQQMGSVMTKEKLWLAKYESNYRAEKI